VTSNKIYQILLVSSFLMLPNILFSNGINPPRTSNKPVSVICIGKEAENKVVLYRLKIEFRDKLVDTFLLKIDDKPKEFPIYSIQSIELLDDVYNADGFVNSRVTFQSREFVKPTKNTQIFVRNVKLSGFEKNGVKKRLDILKCKQLKIIIFQSGDNYRQTPVTAH